ncbi:L,D-transpeptidase [Cohnella yongneupensis]|uniref:L,D-transpeptidase n=1 Tax=Cohnella yongneupensis TaxID=425006 RepID=A0ABW0QZY4_9BACL
MSKEKRIEAQIQHFYDHVPDVDDAFPLKEYLLKHEDSRMAWYLLGKQYESKGDTAKATYCFGQAGDIYTAFEGKPAPALPDPQEEDEDKKERKAFWIWASVFVVLLGAIGLGIYALAKEQHRQEASPIESAIESVETAEASPIDNAQVVPPQPVQIPVASVAAFGIVSAARDANQAEQGLGSLLMPATDDRANLLVQAMPLDKWNDWLKSGKPLASVVASEAQGVSGVNWFDAKTCNCKPQEPGTTKQQIKQWKPMQESKLVMRSAILSYHERKGVWPASPEALNADYPNNTIAGWSEEMTPWFTEVMAELNDKQDGKLPSTIGWPTASGPASGLGTPAGALAPLTKQPVEIVVDKSIHRLAVVSGDVILRNYEVGLGGGRTPEGSFVITEKVRNPNGTDKGKFGSRGMTLSDSDYGIHGTDKPGSMGKDESLGCVRMKKEDIEELFDMVPLGTKVTISKGSLPNELRVPAERFKLSNAKDETNPHKVYDWLD